jgi:hypothetical protein
MGMKKVYALLPVALAGLVGYAVRADVVCFVALAKFAGHVLYFAVSVLGC